MEYVDFDRLRTRRAFSTRPQVAAGVYVAI